MYLESGKRRIRKKIVPIIMSIVGIAAMVVFFYGKQSTFQVIKQEIVKNSCNAVLQFYLPFWQEDEIGEKQKNLLQKVCYEYLPFWEYVVEVEDYDTQIESALSYDVILKNEARDENYIDESTGEVILTGESDEMADEGKELENGEEVVADGNDNGEIGTGLADEPLTEAVESASVVTDTKAVTYALDKLGDYDYLIQNFYRVDKTTTIDSSQLNASAMLEKNMKLTHDASTPQILIYHTHSQEAYSDSIEGDASMSVVGVGEYLTQILKEQYGLNVIHHTGEYDVNDRDHAYSNAAPALEQLLKDYPSIEVVIDLHRDGVKENVRLVTDLNGTKMAQIMFFNGLSRTTSTGDISYLYNPYISDNLAFSFQMQLAASEYYPGFTRPVYLKGYRYNMHYCPKSLLVEVGAQTNTLEEAMNAMVPLADILNKVIVGEAFLGQ